MKEKNMKNKMLNNTRIVHVSFNDLPKVEIENVKFWLKGLFDIELKELIDEKKYILEYMCVVGVKFFQICNVPIFEEAKIINQENDLIELGFVGIDFIEDRIYDEVMQITFETFLYFSNNVFVLENITEYNKAYIKKVIEIQKKIECGKSTIPILKTAHELGIDFFHLGMGIYQLGWGINSIKLDKSTNQYDSAMGMKISKNKVFSAKLIEKSGYPSPTHFICKSYENALKAAVQLKYPVVIKPADLDRGEGVFVDINNETELKKAFEEAYRLSFSKQILVEKQVKGTCHRLLMIGKQMLYCIKRNPVSLVGNGINTVDELIDEFNLSEMKKAFWDQNTFIKKDQITLESIKKSGYSLTDIPEKKTLIATKPIESTLWGGNPEDVTYKVNKDNIAMAQDLMDIFELDICGIDLITEDISIPWYENQAIVNEINYSPLVGGTEISKMYLKKYIELNVPCLGEIPVKIIEIENFESEFHRMYEKRLDEENHYYFTTANRTYDDHFNVIQLPFDDLKKRVKALALDQNVRGIIIGTTVQERN